MMNPFTQPPRRGFTGRSTSPLTEEFPSPPQTENVHQALCTAQEGQQHHRHTSQQKREWRSFSSSDAICIVGTLSTVALGFTIHVFRKLLRQKDSLHEQLKHAHFQLEDKEKQYNELTLQFGDIRLALDAKNIEVLEKDEKLSSLMAELEEKTEDLELRKRDLEKLKGELGLSKSTVSMVERELKATKRLLASYQGQLDQAHVLRESNRDENVVSPGSLGIGSLLWQ